MKKYLVSLAMVSGILFSCKNKPEQQTLPGKKGTKMTGHVSTHITATPQVIPIIPEIDPQPVPAVIPLTKNYSLEPDSGKFELSSIDATDGLPEGEYYGILQDRKGYLWLSSNVGLLKFDGTEILSYPRVDALNFISVIQEDRQGNLLFLGSDFTRYDGKTFEDIRGLDSIKLTGVFLTNMEQDAKGNFWFPVRDRLVKYDGINLTVFTQKDALPGTAIKDVALDQEGNVYVLQQGKEDKFRYSVLKLDGRNFVPFIRASVLPPDVKIEDIAIDDKGNTWLATAGSGIMKYNDKNISTYTTGEGLAENSVRSVVKDKSGGLWFAYLTRGYSYFNGSGFQTYTHEELSSVRNYSRGISAGKNGNAWIVGESRLTKVDRSFARYEDLLTGIKGFTVTGSLFNPFNTVTRDRKGNLWFCNHNSTIYRYNGKTIAAFSDSADFGTQVNGIIEDRKGNTWFATGRGITRYDGQFFKSYKKANGLGENRVSNIIEDRSGNLWLATTNAIHKFDGNAFTRYPFGDNKQVIVTIRTIYEDSRGNIWFGWRGRGVSRFDGKSFTDFTKAEGLADTSVNAITEDAYGNMWFATDEGLNLYDGETIFRYTMDDGLSSNEIIQMLQDTINQVCWLRTVNGITRMTQTANHPDSVFFLNFDQRNGFPVPPGYTFLDTDGTIWLTGAKNKLTRFDYASLKDQARPFILHLKNISLNNEKLCWSNFLPAAKKDSLLLAFEMQLRFGKRLSKEALDQMKEQHRGLRFDNLLAFDYIPQNLVLPYSSNTISFDFAAIDPYFSKFTRYQYRLEGLSNSWSPLSKNASANFGNLKEGRYTFRLKALNPYGLWSEMSYSFRVLAPWWRSWWAYVLYILGAGLAVYAFTRWRTRSLQKEKIQLEEKVETRTSELKESLEHLKATQSQLIQSEKMASLGELTAGIAHEIQNPLNFVNNFSEVNRELLNELNDELDKGNIDEAKNITKDAIGNEEKIIHHGKRADAIVKGMLQHSRSSSGVKESTDINALCDEYLRLAYHGLRAKDKSFNAVLKTDFDPAVGKIPVVPQDMGRVILNLINNAFYAVDERKKTMPALLPPSPKGEERTSSIPYEPVVTVTTKRLNPPLGDGGRDGGRIEIRVADNGNGIPQKILDKIFQPFFTTKPTGQGTGLGLSLSYDIIRAHGGEIRVETKEARPDDPVGRGEGSEFIILLPTS